MRAAYDAPFPTEASKAGPRAMPELVPTSGRTTRPPRPTGRRGPRWGEWDQPFLSAFGDSDPITGAMAPILERHVPGADGQPTRPSPDAGHFLQEDAGAELGALVRDFMGASGTGGAS